MVVPMNTPHPTNMPKMAYDFHLFFKQKFDQYSARTTPKLIIKGVPAKNLQVWSSYQYSGCSNALRIGIKVKKLPTKQDRSGPLQIDT